MNSTNGNTNVAYQRSDDEGLRELALFAGAGGGILGGHLLGWRTVCAVEWEPYPASILAARQNDGVLPPFPIWDDVQTFDGRPWRGRVDVVSGGFPCQDISSAGKGAGIDGERSGLWKQMARIIGEVRPRYVFVENSPMLIHRGLAVVISDLAEMGYDCQWCIVSASDCGAPHKRDRIWIVAHATQLQCNVSNDNAGISMESEQVSESGNNGGAGNVAHAMRKRSQAGLSEPKQGKERIADQPIDGNSGRPSGQSWWSVEPNVGRVVDRVAARVDRLKAIGNGQVPVCAATAFNILSGLG